MIPRGLLATLGAVLVAAFAGFLAGRWSVPRTQAPAVTLGSAQARPGADLGPKAAPSTIKLASTHPGTPQAPPRPAPATLGQHLSTTTTALPSIPDGGLLHAATFANLDHSTLTLRTVEWLDTPKGPAPLGQAVTVERVATLHLPAPPALPRWQAVGLATLGDGRPRYGAALAYARGPLVVEFGHLGGLTWAGAGARW